MSQLLITNLSEIVTPEGSTVATGEAQSALRRIAKGEVLCRNGRIVFVGTRAERMGRYGEVPASDRYDAGGGTLIPGLVDCHTHLPWAGSRESEFARRLAGDTYLEIAAAGGGILSTVRSTREASQEELAANVRRRLDRMLSWGTTTAEAKSGYGLDLETERRQLLAIRAGAAGHPIEVVPTLMAAHEFPPEYREDRDAYVDLVCETIIPALAGETEGGEPLAKFCDVFCEQGVYTVEQSRRVLEVGREHGLLPRLHADEFVDSGGAELAAELGAVSADHVAAVSDAGLEAMAKAGVIAVLLPGVNFFLMKDTVAPARRFIEAGVPVALATDCNPGSSHTENLFFILWLAVFHLKMSLPECLTAMTLNPACCLGLGEELGTLERGKRADLVLLDTPNLEHVAYHFGVNPVKAVFKGGKKVLPKPAPAAPAQPQFSFP